MSQFQLATHLVQKTGQFPIPGVTAPRQNTGLAISSLQDYHPPNDQDLLSRFRRRRAEARRLEDQLPQTTIDALVFSLFSTEEIDRLAVVRISNSDWEGPNTVRDLKLGPQNEMQKCETCAGGMRSCLGHYGKIDLPRFFHPLAVSTIIKILECVCNSCGGILVSERDLIEAGVNKMTVNRRIDEVLRLSKAKSKGCNRYANVPGVAPCQPGVPIYGTAKEMSSKTGSSTDYKITYKYTEKGPVSFRTPEDVFKILDMVSDSDAILLGFGEGSHPRTLCINRLLVIPYCARPDLRQDDNVLPDDLSSMYIDIVKKAREYFSVDTAVGRREELMKELYFRISHLMRNEKGQYRQGSVKEYTDITSRIQGKEALIRAHIMGKRVNFVARTVASPGKFLRVNQIQVPSRIAVKLTRPFRVTAINRTEFQASFDARRIMYITPSTGRFVGNRIMVTNQFLTDNPNYKLQIGDRVDRMFQTGDYMLINRQPTLHRQSIVALEGIVSDERTLAPNLSITTPLNLDFDGDELNAHLIQTPEAYAEAVQLFSVEAGLMNDQNNSPMFGIVYNGLTAAYLLSNDNNIPETRTKYITAKNTFDALRTQNVSRTELREAWDSLQAAAKEVGIMDEVFFNECLMTVADQPQHDSIRLRVAKEGQLWLTKEALISASFPEDFYYDARGVVVRDGVLIKGALSKETIGRTDGGIISEMMKSMGSSYVVNFMSCLQFICNVYLEGRGFTVGLDECLPTDPEFEQKLEKIISDAETKALAFATTEANNPVEVEAREQRIISALSVVKSVGDTLATTSFRPDNAMVIMSTSGAKGTKLNTAQISSLIGLQRVNNKRIPASLPGGRSLPIFRPGDQSPASRGFCRSSFSTGLMPDEMFFHAMSGREGLTDTATNTAKTGALNHQLIKAAEDVHISGDGSVRVADGSIIQFVYGGDGFNAGELGAVQIRGTKTVFFRNLQQLANKISLKHERLAEST